MNFFNEQVKIAKDNYNYFFMRLFFSILKIVFKLSCLLLLSSIFNYLVINIIVLIATIYYLYNVYYICSYYFDIINDIKDTLGYNNYSFELDFSLINNNIFKGMVKYGK